jgi:predicted methyltransferase
VTTQTWDYRQAIPTSLLHKFDTVVVDPPYSLSGLVLSISRAIGVLKQQSGTEIYLSFAHRSPSEWLKIQQKLTQMGLAIQEIIPRFNMYEGCDILGNITQMVRLLSTEETKPLVDVDQTYESAIYTGEINPKIRYYYCVACRKLIELSSEGQIKTIEKLKSDGCPYCKSKGPFELDEKIEGN